MRGWRPGPPWEHRADVGATTAVSSTYDCLGSLEADGRSLLILKLAIKVDAGAACFRGRGRSGMRMPVKSFIGITTVMQKTLRHSVTMRRR